MFENIGKMIKSFSITLFWIEVVAIIIGGLVVLLSGDEDMFLIALLIIGLGIGGAWISSMFIYGFGELVDNSSRTVSLLSKLAENTENFDNNQMINRKILLEHMKVDNSENKTIDLDMDSNTKQNTSSTHMWRCNTCGNMINTDVCPYCGQK